MVGVLSLVFLKLNVRVLTEFNNLVLWVFHLPWWGGEMNEASRLSLLFPPQSVLGFARTEIHDVECVQYNSKKYACELGPMDYGGVVISV